MGSISADSSMGQVCLECGASNMEGDRFCRNCGKHLSSALAPPTNRTTSREASSPKPWVAIILIAVLLLTCVGIIGIALLDELMPAHPLSSLLVATPTIGPTATFTRAETGFPAPTRTPMPERGTDRFEPDDTMAEANEIDTDSVPQPHTLSPAGDRDYLFFHAREGVQYTIETGDLGDECDTVLTLFAENGTELASDDDGGDEALASRLGWIADEDTTMFIQITSFTEEAEGKDTEYDVWVSESGPTRFEEDEYEPDDTMVDANEILLDTSQVHNIHAQGDQDWVLFRAEEGITYVIETSMLRGEMDSVTHLYDEDGNELAYDDDGGEENLASRIAWTADSTGIMYVMVQHFWDNRSGPDMQYTLSVTVGEPVQADSYEPDDTREQAAQIEVGVHQSHNLHVTGDHDWISFQATTGTTYVIETFNLGSRIDTVIHLYDADGQRLASDDDGADEPLASRIIWTAEADGLLYVMIQEYYDNEMGPGTDYSVSVREQGGALLVPDEYEPDDTMAEARDIEMGQVQTHSVHIQGDHDWLAIRAVEGTTYVVETSNLGQEVDTIFFLYDEGGEELAQDDDGAQEPRASRLTWTAKRTATYYIMVRDYKDNRAHGDMGYDISVVESEASLGAVEV